MSNNYQRKWEIRDLCFVQKINDNSGFVGIKIYKGKPQIFFPMGFALSENKDNLREDIHTLINVLKSFTKSFEFESANKNNLLETDSERFFAYERMLLHYFKFNSYHETSSMHNVSKTGKINWRKTINKCRAYYIQEAPYYFDFIVKRSRNYEDVLINKIYKFCVKIAYEHIGWLYTDKIIKFDSIAFDKNCFESVIMKKLCLVNRDDEKELFADMLTIISGVNLSGVSGDSCIFGTYYFEYVWEKLIDRAFGIKNKEKYFPRSFWHITDYNLCINNRALQPDTIMIYNNNIYILDAKYYPFASVRNISGLPDTSSIHKQITYGEFIDTYFDYSDNIYNAFIIPSDMSKYLQTDDIKIKYIGYAFSDWKKGTKSYEKIAGILIDTKYLLYNYNNDHIKDMLAYEICYNIKA